ncbi:MAG: insulinase family protein, partial [Candidatus Kerfeldbacteria bacterium]|nr:insulinase family protein [Candidatus Kerfeldbacteria bacterium]
MVARYFPGTGRRTAQPHMLRKPIPRAAPRLLLQHKKAEQAQLCLGYPAYPYGHPQLDALRVLTVILGGNMSSRLFISIRERRGLAYSIRASTEQYNDAGVVTVQAGVHRERIQEALKAIFEELQKVKEHGVTAEELANAKEYLAGTVTLELEDSQHVAWWYGRQRLIAGTAETPEERLTAIRRVTARDVQQVANDLFTRRTLAAAIIGPYENRSAFLKLLRTSPA